VESVEFLNGIPCREWAVDGADTFLLLNLPSVQLSELLSHLRPLADEPAAELRDRLFRGVKRPFHYRLATGWMGDALRMDRGKARHISIEKLNEECGWSDDMTVFIIHHTQHVVVGQWSSVREYLRAGWLDSWTWNNIVVCDDDSGWAAVYWEGDGPRCIRRGERRLLARG
jgi:hypothetical protein